MPRGAKPGERRGGRQKGTPNKATLDVSERLAELNCDPITGMARIALGDVPCAPCGGKGRVPPSPSAPKPKTAEKGGRAFVACPDCRGTGKEPVPLKLKADMLAELANYIAPKRRAIDHRGDPLGIEALLARLDERGGGQS